MNYIERSDYELVNVREIDDEHKKIVEQINELYGYVGSSKKETIKFLFKQLLGTINCHFMTEEKFMTENNFLQYYTHKMEHSSYFRKLKNFNDDLCDEKIKLNMVLMKSLKSWFINHLKYNDLKLGKYLNSVNIH